MIVTPLYQFYKCTHNTESTKHRQQSTNECVVAWRVIWNPQWAQVRCQAQGLTWGVYIEDHVQLGAMTTRQLSSKNSVGSIKF